MEEIRLTETVTLKLSGMSCAMCSAAIEEGLENLQAVIRASVSYAKGKAIVEYDTQRLQLSELMETIQKLGYSADEHPGSKRR